MMEKLVFSVVFVVFSMSLANGLSIVNAQENIQVDKNLKSIANFTKIFGEPIYKETSRLSSNSIVLNVEGDSIKTQDFYIATGILKDVRNVTEKSTFIATYQPDGTIIDTGNGIITTIDGEIATYSGIALGITDKNGTQIYNGMHIYKTDSDGKLAFLDNLIGIYEYKHWTNGTKSGIIWEWK
jgi:hypothetical protein